MTSETTLGSSSSHFSALAVASRLVSTPSRAHSCNDGPLICAAAGGLPDTTRDFSTVMAASPPPPATAKSFQLCPLACMADFSAAAALASPPLVHQCSTSTSPACTLPAASTARATRRLRITIMFLLLVSSEL